MATEANRKRFAYDYRIGDEILKLTCKLSELAPRAIDPHRVKTVHANRHGTIPLNAHTIERTLIQRIKTLS